MKLLITGAFNCSDEQLNSIREMGHSVVFMQYEKDDLPCSAAEIEGVICNSLFMHHDIAEFSSLRYIQLTSAGLERVPIEYIKAHGIEIHNARGVYSVPLAEFALCGVLQLYKHGRFFYENQKCKKWEKRRDIIELCGKTVLIVGCGSVGTECAKRFKGFDCNVVGIDVAPVESVFYDRIAGLERLGEILPNADIVVLTLPLNETTERMFDRAAFDKMKTGAVLVNIARGAIVEETALIDALDKKLYGAVLDVFAEEPLSADSPLWQKENVIITPHNSFVGDKNLERLFITIKRNLINYVAKR